MNTITESDVHLNVGTVVFVMCLPPINYSLAHNTNEKKILILENTNLEFDADRQVSNFPNSVTPNLLTL